MEKTTGITLLPGHIKTRTAKEEPGHVQQGVGGREGTCRSAHVGRVQGTAGSGWELEDVGHCHSTHQFPQWDPLFLFDCALSWRLFLALQVCNLKDGGGLDHS